MFLYTFSDKVSLSLPLSSLNRKEFSVRKIADKCKGEAYSEGNSWFSSHLFWALATWVPKQKLTSGGGVKGFSFNSHKSTLQINPMGVCIISEWQNDEREEAVLLLLSYTPWKKINQEASTHYSIILTLSVVTPELTKSSTITGLQFLFVSIGVRGRSGVGSLSRFYTFAYIYIRQQIQDILVFNNWYWSLPAQKNLCSALKFFVYYNTWD